MTHLAVKPEVEELVRASLELADLGSDAIVQAAVSANLMTVLMLAETIKDVGYEAAPIFRP